MNDDYNKNSSKSDMEKRHPKKSPYPTPPHPDRRPSSTPSGGRRIDPNNPPERGSYTPSGKRTPSSGHTPDRRPAPTDYPSTKGHSKDPTPDKRHSYPDYPTGVDPSYVDDEYYLAETDSSDSPKDKKSQYLVFLIATVCVGVVLCIIVFAFVFNSINKNKDKKKPADQTSPITQESPPESTSNSSSSGTSEELTVEGIIKNITSSNKTIFLYNYNDKKTISFSLDNESVINDKRNSKLSFNELKIGDIINATVLSDNNYAKSLSISSNSWERTNIRDLKFNVANRTVAVGTDTLSYDDETICLFKEQPHSISAISESDTVTLKGIGNNLLFIDVIKSHGAVSIINKDHVKDGNLEIDSDIYVKLAESEDTYSLSEGTHTITVTGSNISTFSEQFTISEGKVHTVDLNKVESKTAILNVIVNERNYNLFIDGKEASSSEPVILDMGTHKVRVEKEGFKTKEVSITIKESMHNLEINLEKTINTETIMITSSPVGSSVYINNEYIGISPVSKTLNHGSYTLLVKKEGYDDSSTTIVIDGSNTTFEISLVQNTFEVLPAQTDENSYYD